MRRWRLRTLAAIAALLLTAAALPANSRTGPAGALLLAARPWPGRPLPPTAALLLTAAAPLPNSRTGPAGALLLAALAGIVLGNLLAERIDRLRGALLERVRPNGERLPGFRIAEIQALGSLV